MQNAYKATVGVTFAAVLLLVLLSVSIAKATTIDSLIKSVVHGPHIGEVAPAFKTDSTTGTITFPENYAGKWVVLFSYPADFRPVSESEFKKLAGMTAEFDALNAKIIAISSDPKKVHLSWQNDLAKTFSKDDKCKSVHHKINFPIVADEDMTIAQKYDMVHTKESPREVIRSVYIIDRTGVVRAILHYPIANGRNFSEVKRLLQALQATEKQQVATLADWNGTSANTIPLAKESKTIKSH